MYCTVLYTPSQQHLHRIPALHWTEELPRMHMVMMQCSLQLDCNQREGERETEQKEQNGRERQREREIC